MVGKRIMGRYVWEAAVLGTRGPASSTTRLVLLALATHVARGKTHAWPSIRTLEQETRLSNRSVINHLEIAVAEGWLRREFGRLDGMRYRGSVYYLTVPPGGEPASPVEERASGEPRSPVQEPYPQAAHGARGAMATGEPGASSGEPGATSGEPGAGAHYYGNREENREEEQVPGGATAPRPIQAAFDAYAQGIKAKYGGDHPCSKKALRQLATVAGRVGGADNVAAVVGFYLASSNPFYARVKHSLDVLVKDCERLFVELQAAAGSRSPRAPSQARVELLAADGHVQRDLGEFPAGPVLDVAKGAARSYSGMIDRLGAKYVAVRLGAQRSQFSVEELKA